MAEAKSIALRLRKEEIDGLLNAVHCYDEALIEELPEHVKTAREKLIVAKKKLEEINKCQS